MKLEIHVFHHLLEETSSLAELTKRITSMATDLNSLRAEVERNTEVDQSAITLLNGLSQQLAEIKNDPQAVQELSDQLRNSSDQLAQAVTANTPAQ